MTTSTTVFELKQQTLNGPSRLIGIYDNAHEPINMMKEGQFVVAKTGGKVDQSRLINGLITSQADAAKWARGN